MAFLDHEGGADFPHSRDDLFEALLEAIPTVHGMTIHSSDKLSGHIVAKAGVSWKSWGENIPITLVRLRSGGTRVSVTSTPKTGALFGGALDLGKNRANIESILSAVSRALSTRPIPGGDHADARSERSVSDRLKQLQELLHNGLITAEDHEERKKQILSEI